MSKERRKSDRTGIMSGLARLTGRATPSVDHARDHLGYSTPKSRRGRRGLLSYHDPAVIAQLKELAIAEDTSQQKLLAEALNLVFTKYGRPAIA